MLLESVTTSTGRLVESLPQNRGPVSALVRHGERLAEAQMLLTSVHVLGRVEATTVGVEELQVLFAEVLAQLKVTQMQEMATIVANLHHELRRFEHAGGNVRFALEALGTHHLVSDTAAICPPAASA